MPALAPRLRSIPISPSGITVNTRVAAPPRSLAERPDWQLFRDGAPGGELLEQIGARADRVVARIRSIGANVLAVSSAHFSRVLTARWLGLPAAGGRYWFLSTASLSILGYEHNLAEPIIRLWNDTSHLGA